MTIRIYLRRSDERKQGASIGTQRAKCDEVAAARFPGVVVVYYSDGDGKHARDDMASHTDWHRLLREAEDGDVVITYERSRIGADLEYPLALRDLGTRGVALVIAATGETPKMVGGISDLVEVLHGLQNKEEVNKIRSRTRDALRSRAARGNTAHFLGYGYRSVATNPAAEKSLKRDEIDPGQAAIVLRFHAEYLAGDGPLAIAKRLNADGVRGPSRGGTRKGRPVRAIWTGEAIAKMLAAPIYRGELRYAGAVYHREDLVIIGPELAARVDAARASRAKESRPRHVVHPLAGWGRCSECGGSIASHMTGAGKVKYVCDRRRRVGDCHVTVRLAVEAVERVIIDGVMTLLCDDMIEEIRGSIRSTLRDVAERAAVASATDVATLRAELAQAQARKRRAFTLAMATDDADAQATAKEAACDVRAIELRIAAAERPAIDEITARRIEVEAIARIDGIRASLTERAKLRSGLQALFPGGLVFTPDGDGWIISGDAYPVHFPLERPTEEAMYSIPFRVRAA